jgi:hypothetical protein
MVSTLPLRTPLIAFLVLLAGYLLCSAAMAVLTSGEDEVPLTMVVIIVAVVLYVLTYLFAATVGAAMSGPPHEDSGLTADA